MPRSAAIVMVGVGLPLLVAAALIGPRPCGSVALAWTRAVVEVLVALLVAAMAARWAGHRFGTLAGGVYIVGAAALMPWQGDLVGSLLGLAMAVAVGAFALSNVPGRLPLVERRWPRWAFAAATGTAVLLTGPIGVVPVAVACAGFALLSADQRAARFFADRTGTVILCVPTAVRLLQPAGWRSGPLWLTTMVGPVEPVQQPTVPAITAALAVVVLLGVLPATATVVVGVRQGHYATPCWRLTGCWVLASSVLLATGALEWPVRAGTMLAPLAILVAAAWSGAITSYRARGYRRPSARATADA